MLAKATLWCSWLAVDLCLCGAFAFASDSRLVEAVQNRDHDAVTSLLARHVDVNAAQADGATALQWAVHWNDLATVDRLIQAGANVNAANDLGATPLYLACRKGDAAVVEKLLAAGANPNAALPDGETALMTVAATGNVEAAKALLARGADVNAREKDRGQTALMWAAAQHHPAMVQALIEQHADIHARSKGGFTALLFAAQAGDLECARLLLAGKANIDEAAPDGSTPLFVASASVAAIASSNYKLNLMPSHHEKLALFLLGQGADASKTDGLGRTPLHAAVETGKVELVKALLAHGADPNARMTKDEPPFAGDFTPRTGFIGATPFWLAARAADLNLMRILIAGGADPNLATSNNTTPLMVAAGAGQNESRLPPESQVVEAVELCLRSGNDVNAASQGGQTAVHIAAAMGEDHLIEFLFAHGAKLNTKDRRGNTPLDVALTNPSRPRPKTAALLRDLAHEGKPASQ